jgi:hypothetical protein
LPIKLVLTFTARQLKVLGQRQARVLLPTASLGLRRTMLLRLVLLLLMLLLIRLCGQKFLIGRVLRAARRLPQPFSVLAVRFLVAHYKVPVLPNVRNFKTHFSQTKPQSLSPD